jgi:hypothetical protein
MLRWDGGAGPSKTLPRSSAKPSTVSRPCRQCDRSSIRINPIRLTRGGLGGDAVVGPRGLDGTDNVLGAGFADEGNLAFQAVLIRKAMENVDLAIRSLTQRLSGITCG